jgi:galactonate dehydratase
LQITAVHTTLLTGPSTDDPFLREARARRSAAFIEIHTDSGHTGVGETYAGYFFPEAVPAIVDFFAPVLVGQGVDDIPELWSRMYHCGNFWCRVGLGAAVLSGIEAALWDLKGKLEGVPVWRLLGGARHDRLLAYATGGPSNYPKDRLAAKIDFYLSLGFRGFKIATGSHSPEQGWFTPGSPSQAADFEGDKLRFIRAHVGPEIKVMLDGHMGNNPGFTWDLDIAIAAARAVEPFDLFFFEEPLPYTDPWGYAQLRRATSVPIAGGECLTAAYEWRVFHEQESFDIAQPDASFIGGLAEFLRVAGMFDAGGKGIATHSWGAAGSLMQNIHAAFAASNTRILEVAPAFGGLHRDLLADGAFTLRDGFVLPPEGPGLGVVLDDDIKRRYAFVPGSGEFNSVPGKVLVP